MGRFVGFFATTRTKTPKWFDVSVSPILDAQSQPEMLVAASRDVTVYKRAERALRTLAEGTAAATGDDFFHSLARHAARALGARYAFVAETLSELESRSLAFWEAWIALNDQGVSFALINWYSATARAKGKTLSRGKVIPSISLAGAAGLISAGLAGLQLDQINPFRLIGVFPASEEIIEWRWDLNQLSRMRHHWLAQQWNSSGFDEPTAQKIRSETFRNARAEKSAGTMDWLRRLHRSHSPTTGPFSTCMHRADAATVSYTEIDVSV